MAKKPTTELSPEQRKTVAGLEARIASIRGDSLTERQERARDWIEREDLKRLRSELIDRFPKRDYLSIVGRSQKTLDDFASKFDLPIREDPISLVDVIAAFHDLIEANADRLNPEIDDRDTLECEKLRAQIAQLTHRTELLKLDFARENADTIHRTDVRNRLRWLSEQLRQFGTTLGNRFGAASQKAFNELLDKLEREILTGKLAMELPGE